MADLPATAGVAVRPVMDLNDQRVIAYEAVARSLGSPASPLELLDAALRLAGAVGSAPPLVHVDPALLLDAGFDLMQRIATASSVLSEVVWMLPEPRRGASLEPETAATAGLAAAARRHAAVLRRAGFRVGFDSVAPLSMSWSDAVDSRPAFLLLEPAALDRLHEDPYLAALAGLLAFAGRLGARIVAQGVDGAGSARALMEVGVFYGIGSYLHPPVVLDEGFAGEGDKVVRPSWFRERAVRKLSSAADESGVHYVAETPKAEVIDDRHLARLLIEWSALLSDAGGPEQVLEALANVVPQLLAFDRLAIFAADWDSYVLRPKVLIGEGLEPLIDSTHTLSTGITGWALRQGMPYLCDRTAEHPEGAPIPGQDDEVDESMIVIPLVSGEKRLGALDIWRDGAAAFSDHDLERAALLGKLGADAWRSAEQRAELAERVVTDTVTGLLNKRWWDELGPREAAQVLRAKGNIALLLVDLDGFKKVNDSYGHASGDVVLQHVARALSASVRAGDTVLRFGGDEFIILLRDCPEEDALEVARNVQAALARVPGPTGEMAPVTASIGISLFPEHGSTLDEVAANADAAMYRAKALGRNRVSSYAPVVREDDLAAACPKELSTEATGSGAAAGQTVVVETPGNGPVLGESSAPWATPAGPDGG